MQNEARRKASLPVLCLFLLLANPSASHAGRFSNVAGDVADIAKNIEKAAVAVCKTISKDAESFVSEKETKESAPQSNGVNPVVSQTSNNDSQALGSQAKANVVAAATPTPIPVPAPTVVAAPAPILVAALDSTALVAASPSPATTDESATVLQVNGKISVSNTGDVVPPVGPGVPVRRLAKTAAARLTDSTLPTLTSIQQTLASPNDHTPVQDAISGAAATPLGVIPHISIPPQMPSAEVDRNTQANVLVEAAQRKFNLAVHQYDYTSAIQDLDRAVQLVPTYAKAYTLRATAYNAIGDYTQAAKDATQALNFDANNPGAVIDLGVTQLMHGDFGSAKMSAEKALALAPQSAEGYWLHAQALEALGLHESALKDAMEAARLKPEKFQKLMNLAKRGAKLFDPTWKDASYLFREGNPIPQAAQRPPWAWLAASAILLMLGGIIQLWPRRGSGRSSPNSIAGFGGKYRMLRIIGRGGMGEVYEALDQSLNRRVAIKKMSSSLSFELESQMRGFLLKEAKTVAALHHPAIVDIYDIFERGSDIYLVFELVRGKTVQQVIAENGHLNDLYALEILRPVCQALSFAHGQNVVHRDMKPSNIMITEQGNVKVMDFGIARQVTERAVTSNGHKSTDGASVIAHTATVVGTSIYMAPEMEQGIVSKESDIYALGCCLYEILTGMPPFQSRTGCADKLEMKFAPASSKVSGVSPLIDKMLREALEPRMDRRIRTPMEFLLKLESAVMPRQAVTPALVGAR